MDQIILIPSDYPIDDHIRLEHELTNSGFIVPGYAVPSVGYLDLKAIFYQKYIEHAEHVLVLDLNIVLRIANAAKDQFAFDTTSRTAFKLAAFAQIAGLTLDPSIALHELAHKKGHEDAINILQHFRAADNASVEHWLDLSRNIPTPLEVVPKHEAVHEDLSFPLRRWKMNHLAVLKIANLELSEHLHPRHKMNALLQWMRNDFYFAGPAAIFAAMYFAPNSPRRGSLKKLKSSNRQKALYGIENGAWDLTHLSLFLSKVNKPEKHDERYLFVSADKNLCLIAHLLLHEEYLSMKRDIQQTLGKWWNPSDAAEITEEIAQSLIEARSRNYFPYFSKTGDWLERETNELKAKINSWSP